MPRNGRRSAGLRSGHAGNGGGLPGRISQRELAIAKRSEAKSVRRAGHEFEKGRQSLFILASEQFGVPDQDKRQRSRGRSVFDLRSSQTPDQLPAGALMDMTL